MSQHTQEPWSGMVDGAYPEHEWMASHDSADTSGFVPISAGGNVVALAVTTKYSDEEVDGNARRIVACVNACKGITTETLERVDLPISAICLVSQCAEIGNQRDELLDAIKAVLALPEEQSGRIYRTPTQQFRERQREAYQTLHAAIRKIDSTWGGE